MRGLAGRFFKICAGMAAGATAALGLPLAASREASRIKLLFRAPETMSAACFPWAARKQVDVQPRDEQNMKTSIFLLEGVGSRPISSGVALSL